MPRYWYDHVHVVSPEPENTAKFYQDMFGAKQVSRQVMADGVLLLGLDLNGSRVLVKSPKPGIPPSYGIEHFGVQTDDLESAVKELKAKGVQFTQDISAPFPGVKISFLKGPEDVLIELLERSGST